jgi:hypothetical protein
MAQDYRLHVTDVADDISFTDSSEGDDDVSNVSGPGRVMGNMISAGGRRMESIFARFSGANHNSSGVGASGHAPASQSLDPDPFPGEPTTVEDQYTFVTDSRDSVNNAPGAGHTTGRFLSLGGRLIERLLVNTSRRLGIGLDFKIRRLISLLDDSVRRAALDNCTRCVFDVGIPQAMWSASSPLEILSLCAANSEIFGCRNCRLTASVQLVVHQEFRTLCLKVVRRAR